MQSEKSTQLDKIREEIRKKANFYQVCTCPKCKDTCPVHGIPPQSILTTFPN